MGKSSNKNPSRSQKKVRSVQDKETRAAADRYARAMNQSLPTDHRWLLRSGDSLQDISRASAWMDIHSSIGLAPVQARTALKHPSPDHAVVLLDGKVPRTIRETASTANLYSRMCEFEALALAARQEDAQIFMELEKRGAWTYTHEATDS